MCTYRQGGLGSLLVLEEVPVEAGHDVAWLSQEGFLLFCARRLIWHRIHQLQHLHRSSVTTLRIIHVL